MKLNVRNTYGKNNRRPKTNSASSEYNDVHQIFTERLKNHDENENTLNSLEEKNSSTTDSSTSRKLASISAEKNNVTALIGKYSLDEDVPSQTKDIVSIGSDKCARSLIVQDNFDSPPSAPYSISTSAHLSYHVEAFIDARLSAPSQAFLSRSSPPLNAVDSIPSTESGKATLILEARDKIVNGQTEARLPLLEISSKPSETNERKLSTPPANQCQTLQTSRDLHSSATSPQLLIPNDLCLEIPSKRSCCTIDKPIAISTPVRPSTATPPSYPQFSHLSPVTVDGSFRDGNCIFQTIELVDSPPSPIHPSSSESTQHQQIINTLDAKMGSLSLNASTECPNHSNSIVSSPPLSSSPSVMNRSLHKKLDSIDLTKPARPIWDNIRIEVETTMASTVAAMALRGDKVNFMNLTRSLILFLPAAINKDHNRLSRY